MAAGNVDMVYRDACAHLLAPLNACRRRTLYLPWKCGAERHGARRLLPRRASAPPRSSTRRPRALTSLRPSRSPQRTSCASTRSTSGASRPRRRPRSRWRAPGARPPRIWFKDTSLVEDWRTWRASGGPQGAGAIKAGQKQGRIERGGKNDGRARGRGHEPAEML
jgi:hypothetical protein